MYTLRVTTTQHVWEYPVSQACLSSHPMDPNLSLQKSSFSLCLLWEGQFSLGILTMSRILFRRARRFFDHVYTRCYKKVSACKREWHRFFSSEAKIAHIPGWQNIFYADKRIKGQKYLVWHAFSSRFLQGMVKNLSERWTHCPLLNDDFKSQCCSNPI